MFDIHYRVQIVIKNVAIPCAANIFNKICSPVKRMPIVLHSERHSFDIDASIFFLFINENSVDKFAISNEYISPIIQNMTQASNKCIYTYVYAFYT